MVTPCHLASELTMKHAMRSRRYLTFSLRTLFVMLTALGIWLGVIVNRAREQREAVKELEAEGVVAQYDWQPDLKDWDHVWSPAFVVRPSPTPKWAKGWLGDDYFQRVEGICIRSIKRDRTQISKDFVQGITPHLRRLPWLKIIRLDGSVPHEVEEALRSAVPGCELLHLEYDLY